MALVKHQAPKLYVIADRDVFESDAQWLQATRIVASKLSSLKHSALQIRVKSGQAVNCIKKMKMAREALQEYIDLGLKVIANTTLEQAIELNFSGVHLSQTNTPAQLNYPLHAPKDFLIGASTHDEPSIAKATSAGVHFIVLSPVFAPLSKSGKAMGLSQFSHLSKQTPLPVLALGGIIPKRVTSCITAGAHGVAMISSVMKASDPTGVLESLHAKLTNPRSFEYTNQAQA